MNKKLEKYKEFIDEVVSLKGAATSKWVARGLYPETKENEYRNEVLSSLSAAQREEIAKIVQEAKESGMHDLLAFLNQECSVTYQGTELPYEPFGTELNYDFVARSEGDKWPQ
ncbi:DUF6547 family protein [Shewanella sedimentimangrovi]|uniref:Uncharacterized protein n=1 Tax=Shewanella sedimentimangrovi TaxID=2814293 RepID=A0ABX7R685_9GAMM|nr:DUF6547 family protein [Shewanella sedimentimangrovi]QSX38316.1 hypothetical protein JYB85_05685 [Shewanella sedimentimangrovi]